jgi:DNA modification methylase
MARKAEARKVSRRRTATAGVAQPQAQPAAQPAALVPATLAVTYRPLADLVPYAKNSRTHTPEQVSRIVASIREFQWTNPILIGADGSIIAGHARVMAAKQAGIDPVPCIVLAHLSEEQRRALVIADNQLAISGAGWDLDLLRSELGLLREGGFNLDLLGFEAPDLASIFNRSSGLTDPDAAPPLPAVATTIVGDRWLLDRHVLFCGDATVVSHVERALARAVPALMVTDPPYGVGYDPDWRNRVVMVAGERVGQHGSRAIGTVTNDDRADWSAAWALFPGNVAYVWGGGRRSGEVFNSLRAAGYEHRAEIVWIKTRPVVGRGAYHWQHELVSYVVKPGEPDGWARFVYDHEVAGYAVRRGKRAAWTGGRKQSTVWFIEHLKSDTGHSTQKPVECMRRPMDNNSQPGDLVYDPFVGSGTTIIAAEMAARSAVCIEIDPGYCDVAVERWQAFTGKRAMLDGGAPAQTFDQVRQARLASARPPARRRATAEAA